MSNTQQNETKTLNFSQLPDTEAKETAVKKWGEGKIKHSLSLMSSC